MKCPVCSIDLNMMDRQGVEIDYCPKCRGVWLDRGELDKIIERSDAERPHGRQGDDDHAFGEHGHERGDYNEHGRHGQRKRQGFLGRMLDFD